MNVKLIKVIRKDDNGQITELTRLTMYVDRIMMEPRKGESLGLENGGDFCIHYIKQDLKTQTVFLYQYDDICHREFRDDKFLGKYIEKLYEEGWLILPKK